jgi:hypothetical protein
MRLVNNFNFCDGCTELSCVVSNKCLNHKDIKYDTEYRQLCGLYGQAQDHPESILTMLPVIYRADDERSEQSAEVYDTGKHI